MAKKKRVTTVSGLFEKSPGVASDRFVQTPSGQLKLAEFRSGELNQLILGLSWSHHCSIVTSCDTPTERYFYMEMAIHERWSVRELRRQIDSDLFTRYVSVQENPEKCLPAEAESGDLLPFMDHYVLEFLGLEEEHSERQLRHAILANLRDFFLEFGHDLTFVCEEYKVTCT